MDVRTLFHQISNTLYTEFDNARLLTHDGDMGDYREDVVGKFLRERLPKRYGIGRGQIIGHIEDRSKSGDIIIYDHLDSVPLLAGNRKQVFPIETVYGTIEVKSRLSKAKLIEGLNNIRSIKSLVRKGSFHSFATPHAQVMETRPVPFGFVFAYDFDRNSLDSLLENLKEWENENDPHVWPNLIVILGKGLIYHVDQNNEIKVKPLAINENCNPISVPLEQDTLFHFYSHLLDLCRVKLPDLKISQYFDLPKRVEEFIVQGHDQIVKRDSPIRYKLTAEFIRTIVTFFTDKPPITFKDLLIKQFSFVPNDWPASQLHQSVNLYDPKNLEQLQLIHGMTVDEHGRSTYREPLLEHGLYINVDGRNYFIPYFYVVDNISVA